MTDPNTGADKPDTLAFLAGDGEMARLIRGHDWSATPVGAPASWPQSLRTIIRVMLSSQHPIYVMWGPSLLCFWNDAFTPSLGPERHPGSLGKPGREVWAEIWDLVGPTIESVMAGEGPTYHVNQPMTLTRRGRVEEVYFTYGYSAIDEESAPGGIGGVLTLLTETTEQVAHARAMAEAALTSSAQRDRLAKLVEKAPSFILLLSGPHHRIELVNEAAMTLIGHRDVVGKTVAEALPEAAEQGYLALLDSVFHNGQLYSAKGAQFNFGADPEARTEHFVDFIYQPIRTDTGEVFGIFVLGSDTTERTIAERETRQAEALLRSIIEATPGVIYYKDTDGRMVLGNAGVTELVGKPWSEIKGRTDRDFLDNPEQAKKVMENDRQVLASGETQEIEEQVGEIDGEPRVFLSRKTPLFGEGGQILGLLGVSVDITARKALERELQNLNATLEAQVAERTAALEEAADALRQSQKMEAIGQLTGGIAHDFGNMLQAVVSGLSLAKRRIGSGRPDEAEGFLESARDAAVRAGALTSRLLAFARRQALEPKPLEPEDLITGMVDLIERTAGSQIRLNLQLRDGPGPVNIDQNQLESVLLNLCINARDAMPDGGEITNKTADVRLTETDAAQWEGVTAGDYVRITVTDTGSGMPEDVMAHAFEPFFTTKPEGRGTGLGLSQVYGFVRQSHGVTCLESQLGVGTSVHIYLPRAAGQARPAKAAPDASQQARRILFVEDEAAVRMSSAEALRDLGYDVLEAADGGEALKILRAAPGAARGEVIDLLIADIGLPGGLNGRQVADAARELMPDVPVLLVTGYGGRAPDPGGRAQIGMEILAKPFELDVLSKRVEAMIAGARPG